MSAFDDSAEMLIGLAAYAPEIFARAALVELIKYLAYTAEEDDSVIDNLTALGILSDTLLYGHSHLFDLDVDDDGSDMQHSSEDHKGTSPISPEDIERIILEARTQLGLSEEEDK